MVVIREKISKFHIGSVTVQVLCLYWYRIQRQVHRFHHRVAYSWSLSKQMASVTGWFIAIQKGFGVGNWLVSTGSAFYICIATVIL